MTNSTKRPSPDDGEPGREATPAPKEFPEDSVADLLDGDAEIEEDEAGHHVPRA